MPYQYFFARENRNPGLYYIRVENLPAGCNYDSTNRLVTCQNYYAERHCESDPSGLVGCVSCGFYEYHPPIFEIKENMIPKDDSDPDEDLTNFNFEPTLPITLQGELNPGPKIVRLTVTDGNLVDWQEITFNIVWTDNGGIC